MAILTTNTLISETREYMDAVGSDRWSDSLIKTVLNSVFEAEWSNILNAAPYYKFATRTVTTDADGQFALSDLDLTSGDTSQYLYRIMSVSDGNYLYQQTRFQDVPLATTTNYLPSHPRLYYIAGDNVQILPVASDVTMTIGINYKPQSISDLLSDSSSEVVFPRNSHLILVWEAAAQLLLKGGAETSAAVDLKALAREERESLLDDIRRRTINPTMMAYPDSKSDWASG